MRCAWEELTLTPQTKHLLWTLLIHLELTGSSAADYLTLQPKARSGAVELFDAKYLPRLCFALGDPQASCLD
jgi:hypothetical protein